MREWFRQTRIFGRKKVFEKSGFEMVLFYGRPVG
jgi:hypothetical protein